MNWPRSLTWAVLLLLAVNVILVALVFSVAVGQAGERRASADRGEGLQARADAAACVIETTAPFFAHISTALIEAAERSEPPVNLNDDHLTRRTRNALRRDAVALASLDERCPG